MENPGIDQQVETARKLRKQMTILIWLYGERVIAN
jgi:hypothetical protein